MGDTGDKVILYAAQADAVLKAIERDGRCFSREEYVRRKYGESGPIFLTVYRWFVKEAAKLVPKPEGAEFPYWSFMNLYSLDQSAGTRTLTLCVPRNEAVFLTCMTGIRFCALNTWAKMRRMSWLSRRI